MKGGKQVRGVFMPQRFPMSAVPFAFKDCNAMGKVIHGVLI